MKISFFGHRKIYNQDEIKRKVTTILSDILKNTNFLEFYCGGYGDFDSICYSIVKEFKKKNDNIKILFVSPYMEESFLRKINTDLYDEVIYPPIENFMKRFAIIKRNEWIINQSDLIIFFVEFDSGGAYRALNFAKRKNKHIIHI